MSKVFLSQPMKDLTESEILAKRQEYIEMVKRLKGADTEILDTYFTEEPEGGNVPLKYLAMSIELLADADAAFFADGWRSARGCVIEHICCVRYGIPIIYD